MELIWIVLQYLFPRDPVGQVREVLRTMLHFTLSRLEHPLCEAMLKIDGNRLCFETDIVGMEQMLADLIHFRACQIAKVRWRRPPHTRIYTATHARSAESLLRRFEALVHDFNRIEHLAQKRAARLVRDNILGAIGWIEPREIHRPRSRVCHSRRCMPNHGGFRAAQSTLRRRARRNARGPPTPNFRPNNPASQPPARAPPHPRPVTILTRLFTKNFRRRSCVRTKREYKREKNGART